MLYANNVAILGTLGKYTCKQTIVLIIVLWQIHRTCKAMTFSAIISLRISKANDERLVWYEYIPN